MQDGGVPGRRARSLPDYGVRDAEQKLRARWGLEGRELQAFWWGSPAVVGYKIDLRSADGRNVNTLT